MPIQMSILCIHTFSVKLQEQTPVFTLKLAHLKAKFIQYVSTEKTHCYFELEFLSHNNVLEVHKAKNQAKYILSSI